MRSAREFPSAARRSLARKERRRPRPVTLVALTVTVTTQLVRVLFPIVYSWGERTSFVGVGVFALILFLAPVLTPVVIRLMGTRRALTATITALVAARLGVQWIHPVPLWLAALASAFALIALTLELETFGNSTRNGSLGLALGVIVGLALDTALRSAFWTWDYAWQGGLLPSVLALALSAGIGLSLARATIEEVEAAAVPVRGGSLRCALLGPFLMLQLLFFQNVGFLASQGHLALPASSAIVLFADAVAVATATLSANKSFSLPVKLAVGLGLVAVARLLTAFTGPVVAVLLLAGQALCGGLLAAILVRGPVGDLRARVRRTALAMAAAGFGFVLLTLLYQIHYQVPLPFPNTFVPPVAAAILASGVFGSSLAGRSKAKVPAFRFTALTLGLLVVPAGMLVAGPDLRSVPGNGRSFRLVDYNVRSSVGEGGQLDPEAIAEAIERQHPDVVVLQEVARGWTIAGAIDLASWLSRRLDMPYVFAPAADRQFGNVILSSLSIVNSDSGFLPFGAGPQRRSYARVELDLGDGRSAIVIGTHIQDTAGTSTRRNQLAALLRAWGGAHNTVIAGDLNTQPYDDDISVFGAAGLVSAQDVTGNGELTTSASPKHAIDRVDWIFGTGDLRFSDFAITKTEASDHLPLAVTVSLV